MKLFFIFLKGVIKKMKTFVDKNIYFYIKLHFMKFILLKYKLTADTKL